MKRIIGGVLAMVCVLAVHAAADIGVTISPASWALGTFGPSYYVQLPSITVTNNGTCYQTLKIKGSNSADWNLVTGNPNTDQYKLTRYDNPTAQWLPLTLTTTTLISWFAMNASTTTALRFYGPSAIAETPTQETMQVMFQAVAETGYNYNQGGDFYWVDTTAGVDPATPGSSWGTAPYNSYIPTQDWSYMTTAGSTLGWMPASLNLSMTYGKGWTSAPMQGWMTASSILTGAPTFASYMTTICPFCSSTGSVYTNTMTTPGYPYYWSVWGSLLGTQPVGLYATLWSATNSITSEWVGNMSLAWSGANSTVYTSMAITYSTTFTYSSCPGCGFMSVGYGPGFTSGASLTHAFWTQSVPTANGHYPMEAVILN
jgi:hypothetical protein